MADNTRFQASLDPAQPLIADKKVPHSGDSEAAVQLIMLVEVTGTEGSHTLREMAALDTVIGATNEAAAGTDTATSGLNGLFKRLLQKFTTQFPAALAGNGALKSGSTNLSIPASIVIGTHTTIGIAVDTDGARNLGLVVPSTFDGTTISFQVSVDNATYQALYDITNTLVQMTIAASRSYDLPGELMAWRYFKIVCGTAQATTDTLFVVTARS